MNRLCTLTLLITLVAANSVMLSLFPGQNRRTRIYNADKIALGRLLFFDSRLSNPEGKSCGSCHSPEAGFSDAKHNVVSEGAVRGLFTNRNAPCISYAMFSPPLLFNSTDSGYQGGFFLDGRANTLQEQAVKPLLNPLEMNNTSLKMLTEKIERADYYNNYKAIYGSSADTSLILRNIGEAIALFEQAPEVNPFTSKYDYYLKGAAKLADQELHGLYLFNEKTKGNCAGCHPSNPDLLNGKVLFTDFTYDNIGVPKNAHNPYYTIPAVYNSIGKGAIDNGLGGQLHKHAYDGQFKVPTLRNIALSAPYFHNGYFQTLEEVVHFYNQRDIDHYPPAEVSSTVNHSELGNLHLTPQEEKDIVAFLKTLTDGYK